METPANLGSDFPLNLFMVKGTPVSRLKFSSLRWFGFNKPKEHDEHFFELLVPGFEKICIHIYSYMFIYIYIHTIFGINASTSISPSPWFHHQNSRFPPFWNVACKMQALNSLLESMWNHRGSWRIRRMVVFESLKTDDWFTLWSWAG